VVEYLPSKHKTLHSETPSHQKDDKRKKKIKRSVHLFSSAQSAHVMNKNCAQVAQKQTSQTQSVELGDSPGEEQLHH
jgi:hypothetical protein